MALRILVIDREESIRDSFQLHLQDRGHEVLVWESPQECPVYRGHDCANDFPCAHVVFAGYHLQRMNALDLFELMEERGCKGAARNKFVMSGDTTKIDRQRAEQIGCHILQKPISLGQIEEIVEGFESRMPQEERLSTSL